MKIKENSCLSTLTQEEINCVGGGGPTVPTRRPLMAEDAYGNKISMEEFMDRQMKALNSGGDARYIWDFNYDGTDWFCLLRR